jgi:hypothetical protein
VAIEVQTTYNHQEGEEHYLFVDQATESGIAIMDKNAVLAGTYYVGKEQRETLAQYKAYLKLLIKRAVEEFNVKKLYCEDIFLGKSVGSFEVLSVIKFAFEELALELSLPLEVLPNGMWKSILASPSKFEQNKDHKQQVKFYVSQWYQVDEPEHVIDAIGMGISVLIKSDPSRPSIFANVLNRRLGISTDLLIVSDIDNGDALVSQSVASKKYKRGFKKVFFSFYDKYDLETNFRYVLTSQDVIAMTIIPEHRTLGQLLLKHRIKMSDIPKESFIFAVAVRNT